MNTWVNVAGLSITETTVTRTEWLHTSSSSDPSSTGANNARVLKKQNGMDTTIEDLEVPKELNKTDTEVPHFVSPFWEDSVQENSMERKKSAHF